MAAATILNFEKQLPCFYYCTNPHKTWWKCCESDVECIFMSENCTVNKVKMAVAAILDAEKLLSKYSIYYLLTTPRQLWWNVANPV